MKHLLSRPCPRDKLQHVCVCSSRKRRSSPHEQFQPLSPRGSPFAGFQHKHSAGACPVARPASAPVGGRAEGAELPRCCPAAEPWRRAGSPRASVTRRLPGAVAVNPQNQPQVLKKLLPNTQRPSCCALRLPQITCLALDCPPHSTQTAGVTAASP